MDKTVVIKEEKTVDINETPEVKASLKTIPVSFLKNFMDFIREQGVVGLAIGVVLAGAVQQVVTAFVADFVAPFLGILLGSANDLNGKYFEVLGQQFMWGHFVLVVINFIIVALVIYLSLKVLGLDRLDKKKEAAAAAPKK